MPEKINKDTGEVLFWPSSDLVDILKDNIPISDFFPSDWPLTEAELRKQIEEEYKDKKDADIDALIAGFKAHRNWREYNSEGLRELIKIGISENFNEDFLFRVTLDKWKDGLNELSIAHQDDFFLCYKNEILLSLALDDLNRKDHEVINDFLEKFLKELFEFAETPRKYSFGTLKIEDRKLIFVIDQEFMKKRDKVFDLSNIT